MSDLKHSQGEHWDDEYPLSPGGALILKNLGVEDAPELRFDLEAIQRVLNLMAAQSPDHFANAVSGNADVITASVFFQYALLGSIQY